MDPFLTPDGAFRVDFEWFEMRMSHWVYNPRVTHLPTGRVVLNLFGTMMDATCSGVTADRAYPPGFVAGVVLNVARTGECW